jgi:hypothetical protein
MGKTLFVSNQWYPNRHVKGTIDPMSIIMSNHQRTDQSAVEELQRLRRFRRRGKPNLSVEPLIQGIQMTAQRQHRRLGKCIDAWEALVPDQLREKTCIESLRQGTLHVTVTSSAVAFELDRAVRSGLLTELAARIPGALQRVRTRIGSVE